MTDIAQLMADSAAGDQAATDRLASVLYGELQQIAVRLMQREDAAGVLLQPTALVNEAYLRLKAQTQVDYQDRAHFIALAVTAMKRALLDHGRRARAAKRGGGWLRVTLSDHLATAPQQSDLLDLSEVLARLEVLHQGHCRVFELRFLGGLTVEETAAELGLSPRTVKTYWRFALAWVARELDLGAPQP